MVVITCVFHLVVCFSLSYIVAQRTRMRTFTKEFMRDNFDKQHRALLGTGVTNSLGFPDMGSGKYSEKLA